jgi:hypothetical protein
MSSGYRSGGIDLDDLFDPYVIGTPPAATGYRVAGVDLAGRYAPLVFGTQRANVGYRIAGGADVATLWAAKGTARYVDSNCGLPAFIEAQANGTSGPLTAAGSFSLLRNGTTSWSPPASSGAWYDFGTASIGDGYEVRFTQTATNGAGTLSATLGTWLQLSTGRTVSLSVTRTISGQVTATRTILVEIRKVGEVTPAASRSVAMTSVADIS